MRKLTLVVCLFVSFLSGALSAEGSYPKVRSVAGSVQVLEPSGRWWRPLLKEAIFRKGSAVRTGTDGAVEIAFDDHLNDILRLGPDSRMNFLNPKDASIHLLLERGRLFVLREREEPSQAAPLTVLTRHFLVEMRLGGCGLETSERRTAVRVFSESLQVLDLNRDHPRSTPRVIAEGLKYFSGVSAVPAVIRRMAYADYGEWRLWMKEMYTAQDDRAVDYLEKISE